MNQVATTQANFRVDAQAKDQFEAIVNQLGMTASTAYNLFINATIQRRGLPFDVVLDPLTIPEIRSKVVAELKQRLALENDPNTKWYSNDQIREELGLVWWRNRLSLLIGKILPRDTRKLKVEAYL